MKARTVVNLLIVAMMLFTSFAASQSAQAAGAERDFIPAPIHLDAPRVEGEIVVMMADTQGKSLPSVVASAFATAEKNNATLTHLTADGAMVLRVDESDFEARLDQLNNDPDVLYAEPNYTFSLPETNDVPDGYRINSEYVARSLQSATDPNATQDSLKSISVLQSMQTQVGSKVMATYPNDPSVFQNYGWAAVGADIVWPNTTASANVCVVDSGVDSLHKDLAGKLLTGYDFVWDDTVAQDDNGHGTHVAGIIAAVQNNKLGMAGASTGKVVPVKVMDAQGYGTNYDISVGIKFCANRADIRVINLSLGGPNPSSAIELQLTYATDTKNKLVVVAAGNWDGVTGLATDKSYPAGYSDASIYPQFANKVISVAASGKDLGVDGIDYDLPYSATRYGSWVSVVAPGYSIYSTTPWDKSFYLNIYGGVSTRFGTMSGTSMAAPFVSAAAARYWGANPTKINSEVGTALKNSANGTVVPTGVNQWHASMSGKVLVNVAKLMRRGALEAGVYDAVSGTPLTGAVINAYQGGTLRGSAVIPAAFPGASYTDIINLPVDGTPDTYTLKAHKAGYSVSAQPAFQHEAARALTAGTWTTFSHTALPPKTANFTAVLVWKEWEPYADINGTPGSLEALKPLNGDVMGVDLNMDMWVPEPTGANGVPTKYIIGIEGDYFGATGVADVYGVLKFDPYARLMREGGYMDDTAVETIVVRNRYAINGDIAINAALPYYADEYNFYVTDYNQTIDHDNDGCGDNYGTLAPGAGGYDPDYNPATDPDCPPGDGSGTYGIPLMGTYLTPYIYIWKDGLLVPTAFADGSNAGSYWLPNSNCNSHWWKAVAISSEVVGTAPVYTVDFLTDECDDGQSTDFFPYLP